VTIVLSSAESIAKTFKTLDVAQAWRQEAEKMKSHKKLHTMLREFTMSAESKAAVEAWAKDSAATASELLVESANEDASFRHEQGKDIFSSIFSVKIAGKASEDFKLNLSKVAVHLGSLTRFRTMDLPYATVGLLLGVFHNTKYRVKTILCSVDLPYAITVARKAIANNADVKVCGLAKFQDHEPSIADFSAEEFADLPNLCTNPILILLGRKHRGSSFWEFSNGAFSQVKADWLSRRLEGEKFTLDCLDNKGLSVREMVQEMVQRSVFKNCEDRTVSGNDSNEPIALGMSGLKFMKLQIVKADGRCFFTALLFQMRPELLESPRNRSTGVPLEPSDEKEEERLAQELIEKIMSEAIERLRLSESVPEHSSLLEQIRCIRQGSTYPEISDLSWIGETIGIRIRCSIAEEVQRRSN
jgi:hypothetical protein